MTINTDKPAGEVDLLFAPDLHAPELLDELHDRVLPSVDGASQKGPVRDFIVAVTGRAITTMWSGASRASIVGAGSS